MGGRSNLHLCTCKFTKLPQRCDGTMQLNKILVMLATAKIINWIWNIRLYHKRSIYIFDTKYVHIFIHVTTYALSSKNIENITIGIRFLRISNLPFSISVIYRTFNKQNNILNNQVKTKEYFYKIVKIVLSYQTNCS